MSGAFVPWVTAPVGWPKAPALVERNHAVMDAWALDHPTLAIAMRFGMSRARVVGIAHHAREAGDPRAKRRNKPGAGRPKKWSPRRGGRRTGRGPRHER